MYGADLQQARQRRLAELRRAAQGDLNTDRALDAELLFELVKGGPGSARCNVLTRHLVFRGLRGLGYSAAVIGAAWHETPENVEREATSTLLADPSIVGKIADQVLDELQETAPPRTPGMGA